jgi:NADH dehydrogenase
VRGADTLYNTYWIRFPRGETTFERAVENTRTLLAAARDAGVRRFVHLSVSNPDEASPLPYYSGKARCEQAVRESGLEYAIVRPTLVFGAEDVLVNNIAWILRRLPLFVLPGDGSYRVQPVAVEDVARLCVDAGPNETLDAAGRETMTFRQLVEEVREAVKSRAPIVGTAPRLALALSRPIGLAVRDVVLTREELEGLRAGLLVSQEAPRAHRSFRNWVRGMGDTLGREYASELRRNYRSAAL